MSKDRRERLGKLVNVMERLKDFHQAQHAGHLAAAVRANAEAEEIAGRIDAGDAMSSLFPDLYHRRVADALRRGRESTLRAETEARAVIAADARTNALARAYREAAAFEERDKADKERLEFIQRPAANGPQASRKLDLEE
ncbi:hypothetical protein [Nitratireductor indicus]|uniref:Flagellar FliJ protein n=1 Tax=Nitratireductor indicus C115 TaxID=1231190 RepID=K2P2P2_9HYPH|nr:hypothetical protein [Nitratireductor indicus]EKF41591.1 hypothetical protein NA8A_15321 [Nitratireductor indicus C115]MDS1136119.1 hypothetical protein [Nitratireductor indicus]SFQ70267.1 hypothetical protein SAMN05216176_110127 [Nitratireductor indicus]